MDDKSNFRSFFQKSKNLTLVGIGNLVSNGISSIFWLYLASILEKEEYGEVGFLLAIVGTAGAFSLLGSSSTLAVYVSKGVKIQATIFFITLIAGLIASIFLLLFSQNIFISFYPLAYVVFTVIIFDYLGRKSFANYAKYMIIQRVLMVVFSLVFLQMFGVNGIILGYTLSLASFVFLIYQGFREGKIEFKLLKERKNFIVNSYATHVLEVINKNIDKIIIFPVFGSFILGPYHLGFQIFGVTMILPKIVALYLLPHEASGVKNEKLKKYTIISATVITVLTVVLSPVIIPQIFPKYIEAIEVIQIMGFAVPPASLSLILISELLGSENSKKVAIASSTSIIALSIGIIVLGEYFGLIGLAFALVIAKSVQCSVLMLFKNKILP